MKKNLLICLTILTAGVVMTGCGGSTKKNAATDAESVVVVSVKTLAAAFEDIDNTAEFTSNIQAFKENNIAPSSPVRIENILVDVGSRVGRGQLLATMDRTQYNQAAVQLANLESDFQRTKTVYEAGGISKQSMDQMQTQLQVQKDQMANLKVNTELRSPIDGVVTARNYDSGDMYSGTPVLTVMQINNLKVSVAVSEQYFPQVKLGMPAQIGVDMYADKAFTGKVSLIYPAIDPETRTFNVEITIPNPKQELRPGMFSRTTLHFGTSKSIMVQDLAIQKQLGSNDKYLYLAKDGKAVWRSVMTGRQVAGKIEILNGVTEGDLVIVTGIDKLTNGSTINIEQGQVYDASTALN